MNTSYKQLKTSLALEIRKLGLAFLTLKLGEFLFFDNFFDFPDFLACFIPSPSNLSNSLLLSFFSKTDLLLLFLLGVDLLLLFLPRLSLLSDLIAFNIEVSGAAILLKS